MKGPGCDGRASPFHNIWLQTEQGQTLPFSSIHPHTQTCTDTHTHKHRHMHTYKRHGEDFPGGAVVKNSAVNATRHRFNPWSGKIPHALEQQTPLSPCATTTKPQNPEPVLRKENMLKWEACALQQRVAPDHCNWRKSPCSNQDPAQPKINK